MNKPIHITCGTPSFRKEEKTTRRSVEGSSDHRRNPKGGSSAALGTEHGG
jgi:hypothetical protein